MVLIPCKGHVVGFDLETTGLNNASPSDLNSQPYITEFYGMRIDNEFNIVDEFETFIKPPIPIPEEATKITGITDDMVKDAPSFILVMDRIIELFLGVEVSVAHNHTFDHDVLLYELRRHGHEYQFPWPPNNHCTIELSWPIENKALKLDRLYEIAVGKPRTGYTHRSRKDVKDMMRCYHWLVQQGFVK